MADITRAPVNGVNRIDESAPTIQIFVNVEGAQAPWVCRVTRSGVFEAVEFTGDEGAL